MRRAIRRLGRATRPAAGRTRQGKHKCHKAVVEVEGLGRERGGEKTSKAIEARIKNAYADNRSSSRGAMHVPPLLCKYNA